MIRSLERTLLAAIAFALLSAAPMAHASVSNGFDFPLGSGNDPNSPRITQGWCARDYDPARPHLGVDWGSASGTPVHAISSGWVHRREWNSGYGNLVQIRHVLPDGSTWYSTYGHMRDPGLPPPGAAVGRRQHIGYVGSTGISTGAHLHLAISSGSGFPSGYGSCGSSGTVDPIAFINARRSLGGGLPGEGSFVAQAGSPLVYRIAGGAPIYVSTWSTYGGEQPVTVVPADQFAQYRSRPADGTFIATAQDGRVYRIAGGAPIYVSNWEAVGGQQSAVVIDKWAVDNPENPAAHLNRYPADGTFIATSGDGRVYRIAGGAPIYVSNWASVGGQQSAVVIDKWAVDNPENPAAHLNRYPADGTFIATSGDGRVYRIAGGAPIYVSNWASVGGPQPATGIDKWAVDNADNPYTHLRSHPLNGRFVTTSTGAVYRFAGGAPFRVSTWSLFGGTQPAVHIDHWAITNAGNPHAHVRKLPVDGTVVRGLPSQALWTFTSGLRALSSSPAGAVAVDDAGLAVFAQFVAPSQAEVTSSVPAAGSTTAPGAVAGPTKPRPSPSAACKSARTRLATAKSKLRSARRTLSRARRASSRRRARRLVSQRKKTVTAAQRTVRRRCG